MLCCFRSRGGSLVWGEGKFWEGAYLGGFLSKVFVRGGEEVGFGEEGEVGFGERTEAW